MKQNNLHTISPNKLYFYEENGRIMKQNNLHIIPAHPGLLTVYKDGSSVFTGAEIIAWCIDLMGINEQTDDVIASCLPITCDGGAGSNCIGVKNRDGTINVFNDREYRSIEDLQYNHFD